MFGREERTAVFLLIGVTMALFAACLILDLSGRAAFVAPFNQSSSEGQLVVLNCTIDRITTTSSGGHRSVECGGVPVFLLSQAAADVTLRKGDSVTFYGIVQTYRGKKEIVINDARDIVVNRELKRDADGM